MELTVKTILNKDGQKISLYYIDNEEVTEAEYDNALEYSEDYDTCDGDCEHCDLADEEEQTIEDLIHETTANILDTHGCPGCIEEVLYDFYNMIVDNIVLESIDED
jgi:hypothetical protein